MSSSCFVPCPSLPPPPSCSDTDGGNKPLIKGTATGILYNVQGSYTDKCETNSVLTEYYCSNDGLNVIAGTSGCPAGHTYCFDGACH